MSAILTSRGDRGVATLTLNRPALHNSFDEAMIAAFDQALQEIAADAGVSAVLLRANGASFSAGADLDWMRRMAGYNREENVADASALADLLHRLDTLPQPTLAVVQGPAFGGGVGLVAACDIVLAADTAAFALTEVKLGLIPAVISPYVLAAIGERAARRYFLTGERFSALEAHRLGLIHEVVPGHLLEAAVDRLVDRLAEGAPGAQAAAKALIREVGRRPADAGVRRLTAERIADRRASPEGREGISAFLGKRPPAWRRP